MAHFIYPSFPRPFKNFEVIFEALNLLAAEDRSRCRVSITVAGTENRYAKWLYKHYHNIEEVTWLGCLSPSETKKLYYEADCLLFPSELESWGLPLSEFVTTGKQIIASDLPYAHEAIGFYDRVAFFESGNAKQLCLCLQKFLEEGVVGAGNSHFLPKEPFAPNWEELAYSLTSKNPNIIL